MTILRQIMIYTATGILSSCVNFDRNNYSNHQLYLDEDNQYNQITYNYDDNIPDYEPDDLVKRSQVTIPTSYHIGPSNSPMSARNVDRHWVSRQNPQDYTIDVANDEKPSQVANQLYQLPKNDRIAEVKYHQGGRDYYKGVYGSYTNKEDAEKALNALPLSVKSNASIKNWQEIQSNISD